MYANWTNFVLCDIENPNLHLLRIIVQDSLFNFSQPQLVKQASQCVKAVEAIKSQRQVVKKKIL